MPISALRFTNLGPFDEVEFEFDQQVNVFVGPNNCGKSTALIALGTISVDALTVPPKLFRVDHPAYSTRFLVGPGVHSEYTGVFPGAPRKTGRLGYTIFVPALRRTTDFRSEGPTQKRKRKLGDTGAPLHTHNITITSDADRHLNRADASIVSDEQLVQEIIDLDYRAYRQEKPSMRRIVSSVTSIASEITEGFPIEFAGIAEDERGLYPEFQTPDGKLPLDVLSQGTQSLIQWLARLLIGYAKHYDFPRKLDDKPGILIIDEIDAHLHPSWQRRIIPAITAKFPSLQIFCSTHSPLMLAGLKAGQIHLLTRDAKGKVIVSRNQTDIIGWSADEIVTSFLGVDDATDMKTQENLKRLQQLRDKKRPTTKERKELESLREAVNQGMLSGPAGREVEQFAERLQRSLGETASKKPILTTRKRKKTSARRKESVTSPARRGKK